MNMRMNKTQHKTNHQLQFSLLWLILFTVFFAGHADASRIFFEPVNNTHEVGELFTVNVKLDTQGENINAVDLGILYPPLLEIKSISKSGSAIQLWVQEPNFTSTGIFISGGSPGGIKSSNTLIGKITMKAKAIGDGNFQLTPSSAVLLNDGQGTKASLTMGQASFNVIAQSKKEPTPTPSGGGGTKPGESVKPLPDSSASPQVVSGEEESKDTTKPKKFQIFLGQDPRVFEGKKFISFFTTDSKSGIDHYEVKEGDSDYKIAQSPYLLSDQELRSVIRVRAYDGAGNYRETVYQGLLKRFWLWIIHLF